MGAAASAMSLNMRSTFLVAAFALLLAQCHAWAHDIGSSNATFLVRGTGIDVELYMGLNAADLLIANNGEQVVITPDTFDNFSDRLKAVAPLLYTLTAADGTVLAPDSYTASISDQSDVRFDMHYPLPAKMPGILKIHAAYIDAMVDTHLGSIYVMNAMGDRLGWGEVRVDSEDVIAHLPAVGALVRAPANPNPVSVPVAIPVTSVSRQRSPWFLWVLLGGSALVSVMVAMRGISRQSAERKMIY
jgi:hypothetical protein